MTLVLPYCSDQIENRLLFEPIGSMPCVYDGEPLDFESALMSGEWPSLKDIASEYEQNADSTKATPGTAERTPAKRKLSTETCEEDSRGASEAKKPCPENFFTSSPFAGIASTCPSSAAPTNTSDCSVQESALADDDEEQYLPRRRGPQMWNSRQRWKDERKKVLKMSVGKLTEIEDSELWLLRSVLINNTINRLHVDIRNERQAKIRQRQQKIDFYQDSFEPQTSASAATNLFEDKKPQTSPSDIYDDTSCDEIFGINEEFLRVHIPDRRMSSSPIPTNPIHSDKDSAMDVDSSPPPSVCEARSAEPHHSPPVSFATRLNPSPATPPQQRGGAVSGGGNQCATQYRTNDGTSGCCVGDSSFPPRVPILDSVVYHSLLASLESS